MIQVSDDDKDFEHWLMFRELEDEYRSSLHKYSDTELLAIFPQIKSALPVKIQEWLKVKKTIKKFILQKLKLIKAN